MGPFNIYAAPASNGNNVFIGSNIANYTMSPSGGPANYASTNLVIGYDAFLANTTGYGNLGLGGNVLLANTTGFNNIAIGIGCLQHNTTGLENTMVGLDAGVNNTTGGINTIVGTDAFFDNTTGSGNSFLGHRSIESNTTGNFNAGVGNFVLGSNTTATGNSAMGYAGLNDVTTGSYNSSIGFNTGRGISSGQYNTILGAQVAGLPAGLTQAVIIATGDGVSRADYGYSIGSGWTLTGVVKSTVYTVATLPSAATVGVGAKAFVSDANATTFASVVAGGGANGVPVYSDGAAWRIG